MINFKDTFVSRLEKQLEFIALDSPVNARRFTKLYSFI